MRLNNLHEGKPKITKPASSKNIKNRKKQVMDTVQSTKNGDWTNKKSVYASSAAVTNSDSKLLPNFRGKGLA